MGNKIGTAFAIFLGVLFFTASYLVVIGWVTEIPETKYINANVVDLNYIDNDNEYVQVKFDDGNVCLFDDSYINYFKIGNHYSLKISQTSLEFPKWKIEEEL